MNLKLKITVFFKKSSPWILYSGDFSDFDSISKNQNFLSFSLNKTNRKDFVEINILTEAFKKKSYFISVEFFSEEKSDLFSCLGKEVIQKSYHQQSRDGQTFPSGFFMDKDSSIGIMYAPPFLCENKTFQNFIPQENKIEFSNGKIGKKSIFQKLQKNEKQKLDIIIISKNKKVDYLQFYFSLLKTTTKKYADTNILPVAENIGSLIFPLNYILCRKNWRKESKYLIIPGINYSNKQYLRDAFHQSTVLPSDMQHSTYNAIYPERIFYAENPFLFLIWSYRIYKNGGDISKRLITKTLKFILKNTKKGWYIPPQYQSGKNLGWKSWFDTFYFDNDDSPAYTQSLFIPALNSLSKMGFDYPQGLKDEVQMSYDSLYDKENKYIRFSRKLQYLSVDVTAGDLINYIYFGESIIPDQNVQNHLDKLKNAATPYGYKNISDLDGNYLKFEDYGHNNPYPEKYGIGKYQYGGSWFLYDMMMLLNCLTHRIDTSKELIDRVNIEIKQHFSLHECLSTIDGKPEKSEQGWDSSPFIFWNILKKKYSIHSKYDFTLEVDKIINNRVFYEK